jgi:hypothetical protein
MQNSASPTNSLKEHQFLAAIWTKFYNSVRYPRLSLDVEVQCINSWTEKKSTVLQMLGGTIGVHGGVCACVYEK